MQQMRFSNIFADDESNMLSCETEQVYLFWPVT